MAATTTAFEAELLAQIVSKRDRGLQAGAAYKLRQNYLRGFTDPTAHTLAQSNQEQVDVMNTTGSISSFLAITGP